jgi:molybdopterin/thiamine biosynthesis adenylyltransferase
MAFEGSALIRNSRTILLNGIDYEGFLSFANAKILIVGAGGLSSSVLSILSCAGIGQISIWDGDVIELSNLQRQFIYKTENVGEKKVDMALKFSTEINPEIKCFPYFKNLSQENYDEFLELATKSDLVIDGTDSFLSRSLANKACIQAQKPFFTGSCIGFEGQVYSFFTEENSQNPCYACIFGADFETFKEERTCSNAGIFPPIPSIIGSLIANNVLLFLSKKYLAQKNFFQKFTIFKEIHFREISMKKDLRCEVCQGGAGRRT